MTVTAKLREFQSATGSIDKGGALSLTDTILRERLIREEYEEAIEALWEFWTEKTPAALEHLGKELADLVYVVVGTAVTVGIPFEYIFEAVHASNMEKLNGPIREDGKQLKPEGWQAPTFEKMAQVPALKDVYFPND